MAKKKPLSHDPNTEKGRAALEKLRIRNQKKGRYGKVQSVHGKAAQRAAVKTHKEQTRRRRGS